jgi:DNA integrity scanning protein DisA with diadenylate cyclase activity
MGMSEETDAIVLVVSEENGSISIGYKRKLIEHVTVEEMREFLVEKLLKTKRNKDDSTIDEVELAAETDDGTKNG